MRAGIRYALFSHSLTGVLVRAGSFSLASAGLMALLPVYAKNVLGLGSGGLGLLLAAFRRRCFDRGGRCLPRVRARLGQDAVVAIGALYVAAALLALAIVRWAPLAMVIMVVAGAAWLLCLSTFNVASQEALPGWVRARGLAMYLTAFTAGIALGSAAWGYLADSLGTPATFAWGALAVALTPLLGLRWRLGAIGDLDLTPAPMYAPEMRLAVDDAGGPVFVTVAYEVAPEAVDEFQRAVRRVGRARRRTGAVRWSVYRDAEAPQRFVEMFIVPSWQEHVRQHERRTVSDAALQDDLRAFLRDGTEPEVTHFIAPPACMAGVSVRGRGLVSRAILLIVGGRMFVVAPHVGWMTLADVASRPGVMGEQREQDDEADRRDDGSDDRADRIADQRTDDHDGPPMPGARPRRARCGDTKSTCKRDWRSAGPRPR